MTFTIGSLFDGSGGFPLAAFMCGGVPVWASEVEPYPIAVTKTRFPYMKHLGDISKINGAEIEPVDVITFGSPCQDLSVAGKRAGLKHEVNGDEETTRSGLFMEAVRIIKEMRDATNGKYPRIALWENVPGAFSSNKGEDFRVVLEELIKIVEPTAVMPEVPKTAWAYADCYSGHGWSLAYRVLDAQYWGVPQRRRRIYLVLDLGGGCAREILFERKGLRGNFETGRAPWERASADAEGGAGADNSEGEGVNTVAIPGLLLDDQGGQQINVRTDGKVPTLRAEMHGNVPCVLEGIGIDTYNGYETGKVSSTLGVNCGMSTGRNGVMIPCAAGFCTEHSAQSRGIGYEEEVSPTLRAGVTPAICVKKVLPFDTTQVTSPQNGYNPRWGDPCHPLAAQGHAPTVVCKTYDARGNGDGKTVNTITGDHENRITDYSSVVVEPVFCLQGNGIDRADTAGCNGKGWTEEVCYTLNTIDRPAVAIQTYQKVTGPLMANSHPGSYTGQDAFSDMLIAGEEIKPIIFDKEVYNSGINGTGGHYIAEEGPAPTLRAGVPPGVSVEYIVRRLTPTECARLQGFPDRWGDVDEKEGFTEEEYKFWLDVRNTHAAINGKQVKDYTEKQMLTWYSKLHTDSSEYKMWGNGIALPTAMYVMEGITEVLKA